MEKTSETRVEYGIRYGDGTTESTGTSASATQGYIDEQRRRIAVGDYDADDYEPMTVVARVVTTTTTPWETCEVEVTPA